MRRNRVCLSTVHGLCARTGHDEYRAEICVPEVKLYGRGGSQHSNKEKLNYRAEQIVAEWFEVGAFSVIRGIKHVSWDNWNSSAE